MGYIRMVRSGGLHCVSNAIRYFEWFNIALSRSFLYRVGSHEVSLNFVIKICSGS